MTAAPPPVSSMDRRGWPADPGRQEGRSPRGLRSPAGARASPAGSCPGVADHEHPGPRRLLLRLLLLRRLLVVSSVPGRTCERRMETRSLVPGSMVANLDSSKASSANAGRPPTSRTMPPSIPSGPDQSPAAPSRAPHHVTVVPRPPPSRQGDRAADPATAYCWSGPGRAATTTARPSGVCPGRARRHGHDHRGQTTSYYQRVGQKIQISCPPTFLVAPGGGAQRGAMVFHLRTRAGVHNRYAPRDHHRRRRRLA